MLQTGGLRTYQVKPTEYLEIFKFNIYKSRDFTQKFIFAVSLKIREILAIVMSASFKLSKDNKLPL